MSILFPPLSWSSERLFQLLLIWGWPSTTTESDFQKYLKKSENFLFLSKQKSSSLAVKSWSDSSETSGGGVWCFILMNLSKLISSLISKKLQESVSQLHLLQLLCNITVTQLHFLQINPMSWEVVFSSLQVSALIKFLRTWTSSWSAAASAGWRPQPRWPKPARRSWFWSSTTRLEAAATPTSRRASSSTLVRSVPAGPSWFLLVPVGSC